MIVEDPRPHIIPVRGEVLESHERDRIMNAVLVKIEDVADDPARAIFTRWMAGKAKGTVETYGHALGDFADWMGLGRDAMQGFRALVACGSEVAAHLLVQQYVDSRAEPHAPATVKLRVSALKSVCRLARRLQLIDWSIDVESPQVVPLRDTRGPAVDEVSRLIAELSETDDPEEVISRDRAVLGLLFACALRRGEVAGLNLEHVEHPDRPAVVHPKRKKRTQREPIGLPPLVGEWLYDWIKCRGNAPGPLFVRLPIDGELEPWTGHAIYMRLRRLSDRHNVSRLRPHALRHAAATAMVESHSLLEVQALLGHADPKTTRRYVDNASQLAAELPNELANLLRDGGAPEFGEGTGERHGS